MISISPTACANGSGAQQQLPKSFLAKTYFNSDKIRQPGVTVETHCKIAGAVARELVSRKPEWLRKELFPTGSELIAAAHDIGKVCPDFQKRILQSLERDAKCDALGLDHAAVSAIALSVSSETAAKIVAVHHGGLREMPSSENPLAPLYGGEAWQSARMELLSNLKGFFKCEWPSLGEADAALAVAGLVCVADWIASGELFDGMEHGWETKVAEAVDAAGFVVPAIRAGLSFEDLFEQSPRRIQSEFASSISGPGIYVLEAPMGIGKTEAALYAAYKAMERGAATGIYFALPSQLTSDKMRDRFEAFLAKAFPGSDARLLHSSAWLKGSNFGEEGEADRSWFASPKRGLLAPFAVGTLDQALLSVLNVRHSFVRAYGLAGKIVIIDEAHSYDAYTGTALLELAALLERLHCAVIVLSATLTAEKRTELLFGNLAASPSRSPQDVAYPLISSKPRGAQCAKGIPGEAACESSTQLKVLEGEPAHIESAAFDEALARAGSGQQVIWMENAVDEAQRVMRVLSARLGDLGECGLLHSRFTLSDRSVNEGRWTAILGKDGTAERSAKGRILVGTQVLEQSLDIDADFMVTRLCPVDMLIQRSGRLWRHRAIDPIRPKGARRELWVLSPDFQAASLDEKAFGASGCVYEPYLLCRTLEELRQLKTLDAPSGIRPLMEAVYAVKDEESSSLRRMLSALRERKERKSRMALAGLSKIGKPLPDELVPTRFQDDACGKTPLLLLRSVEIAQASVSLVFADGTPFEFESGLGERASKRKAAMLIERNCVQAPDKYRLPLASLELAGSLRLKGSLRISPEARNAGLAIAILDGDGTLKDIYGFKLDLPRSVIYNQTLGLVRLE